MKKTVCIDSITKMEVILSKCNLDNVDEFLKKENADNKFGKYISEVKRTLFLKEIRYENACFLYDDIRNILLRIA